MAAYIHNFLLFLKDNCRGAIIVSLFVLTAFFAGAQGEKPLMFRHLDVRDGLSNNQISTIFQDSQGLLWIGTASGLNRYDGFNFKNYMSTPDSTTLHSSYIQGIYEDRHGMLWIKASEDFSVLDPYTGKVDRNVGERFEKMGITGKVRNINVDPDMSMWAATDDGYLYVHYPGEEASRMFPMEAGRYGARMFTDIATNDNHVVIVDDLGHVYDIERLRSTLLHKADDIRNYMANDSSHTDYKITLTNNNVAWITSVNGLWRYNLNNHEMSRFDVNKYSPGDFVKDVTYGPAGSVWIALDHSGLLIVEPDGDVRHIKNNPSQNYSLSNDNTTTLFTDKGGTVWVGTYKRGLSYYNDSMFKFRNIPWHDVTCSIVIDGELWAGTDGEGLARWNPVTGHASSIVDPVDMRDGHAAPIVCLYEGKDGKIWVGTFSDGLKAYTPGRGWEYVKTADGLLTPNIWGVAETDDGLIWLATLGGGVQIFNPVTRKFRNFNTSNSPITSDYLSSIIVSKKDKKVYAGSSTGLIVIDPSDNYKIEELNTDSGYPWSNDNIVQVIEDSQGYLWVGTRGGLDMFDPATGKIHYVDLGENFEHPFILGIAEDNIGNIWIAVGTNLLDITPTHEKDGTHSFAVRAYSDIDGLAGDDFNQRSITLLPDGLMTAGNLNGITIFRPSEIKYSANPPRAIITDYFVDNDYHHTLRGNEELIIDPDVKKISINFASNDYVQPEAVKFFYQLEGLDEEWIEAPKNKHQATYTTLSPGEYTFKIKAMTRDGLQSGEESRITIVMQPKWYRTWWAWTLYVLLAFLIIYGIVTLFSNREKKKLIEKQKENEEIRESQFEELKTTFFTNLSGELRTPLSQIISPMEKLMRETNDKKLLTSYESIHTNARKMLQVVNNLLDYKKMEEGKLTLNSAPGEFISFVLGLCDSFLALNIEKRIDFRFIAPEEEEIHFTFDHDKVGKALTTLLNNAYQSTPAGGRITVAISATTDKVYLRISDTGEHLTDEEKAMMFETVDYSDSDGENNQPEIRIGMAMVRSYIELHDGTVAVEDNNNEPGACYVIVLPAPGLTRISVSAFQPQIESSQINYEIPAGVAAGTYIPQNPSGDPSTMEEDRPFLPSASIGASTAKSSGPEQRPLALVVDDNADIIMYLKEGLGATYDIIAAAHGEEALDRIFEEGRVPDIVVSDLMMPFMDGIELCRRLKNDPLTAHIPVMMLTAKDEAQAKIDGLTAGADDYVTKPFHLEEILLRMRNLLSRKQQQGSQPPIDSVLIEPVPHRMEVTSLDQQLIEKATAYIEENIQRSDLTVDELSQHLGVSRVHLYKKMKQLTDRTPTEFIRNIRLKLSQQLLSESGMNIQEIAWRLGFSTPRSFSKYFLEEFGVLPSVYQKNHTQNKA